MATTAPMPQAGEAAQATEEEKLPKLSLAEFRTYNRMADHMDLFHNGFRRQWNQLYSAASSRKRPNNLTMRQYLLLGLQFCSSLETHHSIEEVHIFPVLAKKMPAFRKELELLSQHKQIHAGLDTFQDYLNDCRSGEQELRMEKVQELMDAFGKVLWEHLDDEVKQLAAENMRKYWTKEEMNSLVI
ncbi:MAG: Serine/threonine kinase [Chaenotheca gracillima]|nr:MAG: Serine/threonine kinase [Chaenotheca gracillima]